MTPPPIHNAEVVTYLDGPTTLRDSALVSLTYTRPNDGDPDVDIIFEKRLVYEGQPSGVRVYRMSLRDVSLFEYDYETYAPFDIAFFTCRWTDEDGFYMSLDPYHEGAPSDQDHQRFRARTVSMTVEIKEGDKA